MEIQFKKNHEGKRAIWSFKTEKLESKFENLNVNNLYPISPFKGHNIVDLGFLCQQSVERIITFFSLYVTILRLYLFYVTKNCFILPRKDLKMRSYVYSIHLVWGPVRDAGGYILLYIRIHQCTSVRYYLA